MRNPKQVLLSKIVEPEWSFRSTTPERLHCLRQCIERGQTGRLPSVRSLGRGRYRAVSGIELIDAYRTIETQWRVSVTVEPDFRDALLNEHHDVLSELDYLFWEGACTPPEKALIFALKHRHSIAFNERLAMLVKEGANLPADCRELDLSRFDCSQAARMELRFGEALEVMKQRFGLEASQIHENYERCPDFRLITIRAVEQRRWAVAKKVADAAVNGRVRSFGRMWQSDINATRRAEEEGRHRPEYFEALKMEKVLGKALRRLDGALAIKGRSPASAEFERATKGWAAIVRRLGEAKERCRNWRLACRNDPR